MIIYRMRMRNGNSGVAADQHFVESFCLRLAGVARSSYAAFPVV